MATEKSPPRVLLVGDSLAVGLTAPLGKAPGLLLRGRGVSGSTAHDWVSKHLLEPELASFRPDVVLISLGTNDMRGGRRDFGADAATLLDLVSAAGAQPFWVAPPRMPFDEGTIRASLAKALEDFRGSPATGAWRGRVEAFPSDATRNPPYARAADGIHMPPGGYQTWTEDLLAWAPLRAALSGAMPVQAGARAGAIAAVVGGVALVGAAIYGLFARRERPSVTAHFQRGTDGN